MITVLSHFVQKPEGNTASPVREVKMCDRRGGGGWWEEEGKKEADVNIFMGNGLLDAGEKDNCFEYSFQVPAQFQTLHLSEWVGVCVSVFQCV